MSGAIVRMQAIVNEILLVSRIMTNRIDLSIGPTDLGDITRKVIKSYAPALQERKITVNFNKAEWPERMRSDWELLELAMRNLLSNAIKFTPDGGQVTLKAAYDGEKVRFSVKDSGHRHLARRCRRRCSSAFTPTTTCSFTARAKPLFAAAASGWGWRSAKGSSRRTAGRSPATAMATIRKSCRAASSSS